ATLFRSGAGGAGPVDPAQVVTVAELAHTDVVLTVQRDPGARRGLPAAAGPGAAHPRQGKHAGEDDEGALAGEAHRPAGQTEGVGEAQRQRADAVVPAQV